MAKPKTKIFRLNNMVGGINTVSEEGSLVSAAPAGFNQLGAIEIVAEARDIENFNPLKRGGQQKTFGYTLHKDVGTSTPITGLYRYIQNDNTSYFITSYGTAAYKLVSGTLTTIGVTLTSGAWVSFETADNLLVVCDGTRAPQKWNGSAAANLGGSPPSQAIQSLYYQNRLFIFGQTTDPNLLYYSDAANVESGYASNFINCDIDDGQRITAMAMFFLPGSLEQIIMIGKTRSVGIITGVGTVGDPYTFTKIRNDLGVQGFRQLVQFGQEMGYLLPDGVSSYNASDRNVALAGAELSQKVRTEFLDLPAATLDDAIGFYDWKHNRVGWAVTESSFSYPNVIWYFDTLQRSWYKTRPSSKITAVMIDTDGTMYHGDEVGKIYVWSDTVYAFNSGSISATYKTPHMDFFEPYLGKRIIRARVMFRGNGSYSFGIGCTINQSRTARASHTISISAGSYTWGGGVWTADSGVYQWGAAAIDISGFIPSGFFQTIQFNITQSGATQPLELFQFEFEVEYGGVRV